MRLNVYDDPQQALSFLQSQTAYIESEVYKIQYPEITYQQLIPIDTSAPEWVKSITYYSLDMVGKAEWLNSGATDIPYADVTRDRREQGVEMAGIGYNYNIEEIGQAMMAGINLTAERADAARFSYELFMNSLGFRGDATKHVTGLFNNPNVPVVSAVTGASGSSLWSHKTADEIIIDVQNALAGVYEGSLTVEMADTVLLPIGEMQRLASVRIPNTNRTHSATCQSTISIRTPQVLRSRSVA